MRYIHFGENFEIRHSADDVNFLYYLRKIELAACNRR